MHLLNLLGEKLLLRRVLGFTLWCVLTAFTQPAITPPKVNWFGWNLEHCEPNVGGWSWQTLGAIHTVAKVWEGAKFFFGQVNNAWFLRFPVGQFYEFAARHAVLSATAELLVYPRDAMLVRYLLSLCVQPSVTSRYCIKTAKHKILKKQCCMIAQGL